MAIIGWFDWMNPTNPLASLFFGVLFAIALGVTVWFESRQWKKTILTTVVGIIAACVVVAILNMTGYFRS